MLIAVTGGSGSGKSEFAENCALRLREILDGGRAGNERDDEAGKHMTRLVYLATMKAAGEEGLARVKRHMAARRGKGFLTIERERNLSGLKTEDIDGSLILLEDLSNLIANELFSSSEDADSAKVPSMHESYAKDRDSKEGDEESKGPVNGDEEKDMTSRILSDIHFLSRHASGLILVMNDVFSDGICYDADTVRFMEITGAVNKALAAEADVFAELIYGIPMYHKGREYMDIFGKGIQKG